MSHDGISGKSIGKGWPWTVVIPAHLVDPLPVLVEQCQFSSTVGQSVSQRLRTQGAVERADTLKVRGRGGQSDMSSGGQNGPFRQNMEQAPCKDPA